MKVNIFWGVLVVINLDILVLAWCSLLYTYVRCFCLSLFISITEEQDDMSEQIPELPLSQLRTMLSSLPVEQIESDFRT